MRRSIAFAASVVAILVLAAAPATAQDDLADLPRMGFEVTPQEGFVGDVVEGHVDPDDIEEHCLDWLPPGEEDPALLAGMIWFDEAEDVFEGFGGVGPFYWGEERFQDIDGDLIEDPFFQAYYRTWITFLLGMATEAEIRDSFFSALYPMTFVDPVTQDLLGDLGGYDPFTGEGEVVVPELEPSLYAVAAPCLLVSSAEEQVEGGLLDDGFVVFAEWLEENYPDLDLPEFNVFDEDWQAFVAEAAPVWLAEVLEIQAIGLDFYCILDEDGLCAEPPEGIELLEQPPAEEPPGEDPPPAVEDPPAPAPQEATPRLTG